MSDLAESDACREEMAAALATILEGWRMQGGEPREERSEDGTLTVTEQKSGWHLTATGSLIQIYNEHGVLCVFMRAQ